MTKRAFSGFPKEGLQFLRLLKRHNNREWFQDHKTIYEQYVKQPMFGLIETLAADFQLFAPEMAASPKISAYRIYRDTRFSSDKRPYKTHVAMRFSHRGKDVHSPGFYLHLEPGGCFAASGLWHPEPHTLLKVRTAMVERGDEWRSIRKLLNWDDATKLSRPPRGFPSEHEFVDDLKLRDLGTAIEFTDAQVCSPKFMATFAMACKKMSPLAHFLSGALGLPF